MLLQSQGLERAEESGLLIAELMIMGGLFPHVETSTLEMDGRVDIVGAPDAVRSALATLAEIEKQKRTNSHPAG